MWPLLLAPSIPDAAAAPAEQPTSPWTLRLGPGQAAFDTSTRLSMAGASVPGAEVHIDDANLLLGDVGRDLTEHVAARVAFGLPVTVAVDAAGTLGAYAPPLTGTLGRLRIAPVLATVLYRPWPGRRWQPYVGGGLGYAAVLDAEGRDVAGLEASSEWGPVLEAGCDVVLAPRWSAYVDVRRLYVATDVRGTVPALGGPPVDARVTLDPVVVNLGVGYRF
jgi:outer membrane protein